MRDIVLASDEQAVDCKALAEALEFPHNDGMQFAQQDAMEFVVQCLDRLRECTPIDSILTLSRLAAHASPKIAYSDT
eukprot:COSAG01_NODE_30214_length_620_cov_2.685221_1_plen_77_part_00